MHSREIRALTSQFRRFTFSLEDSCIKISQGELELSLVRVRVRGQAKNHGSPSWGHILYDRSLHSIMQGRFNGTGLEEPSHPAATQPPQPNRLQRPTSHRRRQKV